MRSFSFRLRSIFAVSWLALSDGGAAEAAVVNGFTPAEETALFVGSGVAALVAAVELAGVAVPIGTGPGKAGFAAAVAAGSSCPKERSHSADVRRDGVEEAAESDGTEKAAEDVLAAEEENAGLPAGFATPDADP